MEVRSSAIDYFCRVLEKYEVNSATPQRLRGHLGQASEIVRYYFQTNYWGPHFENFFLEAEEFFVSEDGYISCCSDVENEAVDYFEELFENNTLGLVHYSEIINILEEEDDYIAEYIYEQYPDDDLLKFFEQHTDIFSVANGYVVLISERDLVSEEQDATEYFCEVLKEKNGYFHVAELQAFAGCDEEGQSIVDVINDCYSGEKFWDFLLKYDDMFFIDYEDLVYLKDYVDDDAVAYFKDIFVSKMYHPVSHTSLYGHIGQSPAHVMKYINEDFGRKGFLEFLKMHSDTFKVREQGFVTYIGLDAAVYFANVLEDYDCMPHYSTFRGHIGQAPSYIKNFINKKFPNEEFYDFLLESRSFFDVDEDGNVTLSADYESLELC